MIHIVSGPPCSGKSTYVMEHKQPGDVVIDYDIIAEAVGDTRWATSNVDLVKAMRRSAIDWCLPHANSINAWIIDTAPTSASLARYAEASADMVALDVPRIECERRALADERPQQTLDAIDAYFSHDEKRNKTMQKKSFDLIYEATEDVADGGEVIAYASTFDRVPDSYGDVVARGAFAKTLSDWQASGNPIPLLFGHRTDDPRMNLGAVIEAEEDERGLKIRARFDEENEIAQYTRKLVKEGRLTKLSFAYDTLDAAPVVLADGTRANELRELKLYEVSLVPIPANEMTEVIEAKDGEHADIVEALSEDVSASDAEDVAEPVAKADEVETKAPADEASDALRTIAELADRLDSIAEMIDDMVKRIAVMMPEDAEPKSDTGIDVKQANEADADSDDNEEAPHEGNSEVNEKADATMARMAKYIS
jgi:HK97 family phage prohead protease